MNGGDVTEHSDFENQKLGLQESKHILLRKTIVNWKCFRAARAVFLRNNQEQLTGAILEKIWENDDFESGTRVHMAAKCECREYEWYISGCDQFVVSNPK